MTFAETAFRRGLRFALRIFSQPVSARADEISTIPKAMPAKSIASAVSEYGAAVAERFATGAGEPEDLLRGPFETLVGRLSDLAAISGVVLAGEHHLADERIRPDYAVHVQGALVGFVELKAPGKGANPGRFKGHDRKQWERLACLPNVLFGDGQEFALYRFGERVGPLARLEASVETSGTALAPVDDSLLTIVEAFLSWEPIAPKRPRELALVAARLCRLLRAEVEELLLTDEGLRALAEDWRVLLFPGATDKEFADGYAQAVTFALLLARVEGIELAGRDLRSIADDLGKRHTLMGRALDVLTTPTVLPKLAVSVETLHRVLSVVDWPTISEGKESAWLHFYEDFLEGYDAALRRATGSYYTPVEVVDPMVRIIDKLVRTRLGASSGLASQDVTVVDPGVGTGTFLFRIIDRIASIIEDEEGSGAVPPRLRAAAGRLIGFELQAGPYSVAELRLTTEYARRGATLGPKELALYLTNTLGNPYVAEEHLPALYAPIALSRQKANEIKRDEPVLVVIGNPPYKERSKGQGGWIEEGNPAAGQTAPLADFIPPRTWHLGAHVKHLYNPYVYFWRWATWKVFENHPADKGVVAFITVAGFLNGPGFAEMRAYLRRTADAIWVIDCSPEGHQPDVPTRVFQGVQRPICITIALRDGSTSKEDPAEVKFTSVAGRREEKFAALSMLDIAGDEWETCSPEWTAPFLPESEASWTSLPAIDEVFAWSGSGTMPGRTWVIAPSEKTLRARWKRLTTADEEEKPALLAEHPTDRTVNTRLGDNLSGYAPPAETIRGETSPSAPPIRYAYRSFDVQWIIPDKRVINRPNPALWHIRSAPGQIFLTGLSRTSPSSGPAATLTAFVPDLDHYHARGGRVWPLWLDAAGTRPNLVPGLVEALSKRLGHEIPAVDFFAYLCAVLAAPAYTERFASDLEMPGLRVPITADPELFRRGADLGKRVIWLHTFGERCIDKAAGRPKGPPKLPPERRPRVTETIPDVPSSMPESLGYEEKTKSLLVGAGRVAPVERSVWEYEVSGMRVVKRWFDRRKRDPEGKRGSPLDDIVDTAWSPAWTTELLEILNVLMFLRDLESDQRELLEAIVVGPLIRVIDLTDAGVLPVAVRPSVERPEHAPVLFDVTE